MSIRSNTTQEHTTSILTADPYCDVHLGPATVVEVDRAGNVWRNCSDCEAE